MTWKDGGNYGLLCREITNETGDHPICKVWTRQYADPRSIEPWPEGEANFTFILNAPKMLEALESIRDLAECILQPLTDRPSMNRARWERVRGCAVAAIAAVKGDIDETELV